MALNGDFMNPYVPLAYCRSVALKARAASKEEKVANISTLRQPKATRGRDIRDAVECNNGCGR